MESSPNLSEKSEEPIKFTLVGISGIFVNFVVLYLTNDLLGLSDELSLMFAVLISLTSNYILNRIWTFNSDKPIIPEYLKYAATNAIGALIQLSVAITTIRLSPKENLSIPIMNVNIDIIFIGSLFGILLGFASNFLFSKFYVFKGPESV